MEETFSDADEPVKTLAAPISDDENGFHAAYNTLSDAEADDYASEDEVEIPKFDPKPSHEAKIRELLRNISSIEVKLCADGAREFMKLLRGSNGGEFLYEYVRSSSKFTELMEAWNRWRGKPGLYYIVSLISVILGHPEGRYRPNDPNRVAISKVLDKFSRSIIEEKLDDIYKEINSKEGKRQKSVLLLLGSIVRRGSLLAAEVAKSFDFKLPLLPRLSEYRRKPVDRKKKHSTRGAFVEFAMSFLEAGKPVLLRWILQQREIFSGILRGLGNDDDETVVYVLSTLRDRVLTTDSLVPPSLRSVLFGSVTLEQLVGISAREDSVLAAKAAYEVLIMVCTDPANGLMPDPKRQPSPLKGNLTRLLGLMKKLRATEVTYHRDLLLAIVNGSPSLCSSYLDEFPYNLEDNTSPTWLSAVTLAADVVMSVRLGISWAFLVCQTNVQLTFESSEVQSVFKCVCPRPFSRLVVNKGLRHPDPLIKHGTLRLLLEVLKLFSSFMDALNTEKLSSLKCRFQDEVRIVLPDPHELDNLVRTLRNTYESSRHALKRAANSENKVSTKSNVAKKRKVDIINEDVDIFVGGLDSGNSGYENILLEEAKKPRHENTSSPSDDENDDQKLMEIWGSDDSFSSDVVKDAEVYLYCKVLEALKIFHGAFRGVLDPYDFLRLLPSNPLELPHFLLHSLLSTLMENLGYSEDFSTSMLPSIYKHLPSFLNLSIQSPIKSIKEQAYVLAKAAMRSTGAFDKNPWEIRAWLSFLPVYAADDNCCKYEEVEMFQSLSTTLISFLCDAVSTLGNNLFKYWALLKCCLANLEDVKDHKVNFSPFIICVMEKCLRLLNAESGTFKLPEKTMISLYVCNALLYLLQTQVEAETLAAVIHLFLFERIPDRIRGVTDAESNSCEWRPMVSLLLFSQSILQRETCLSSRLAMATSTSFDNTIAEVKSVLSAGSTKKFAIFKALYFTTICTSAYTVLQSLPSVMEISEELPGFHHYLMNYFYHDRRIMSHVSKLWPQMFSSGLGMSVIVTNQISEDIDNQNSARMKCTEFGSLQHASLVFGSWLKEAPFHILFPALLFCGCEYYSKVKELLITKLSNLTAEQIAPSLRLVLFWFHQLQSSYRKKPSEQLECFSEMCFILVERILAQLSTVKVESGSPATLGVPLSLCIQEVSETVFCHPVVLAALSCPSDLDNNLSEILLTDNSKGLLDYCGERIRKPELHVLNMLSTTCDYLLVLCSGEKPLSEHSKCRVNILNSFRHLIQRLILNFMERVNLWYRSRDITFFPVLSAILGLKCFISPIVLLELADWMLARDKASNFMLLETSRSFPMFLAFSVACAAFDSLAEYLQPSNVKAVQSDFFWGSEKGRLDPALFERIYSKAFEFATSLELDLADLCLLKALHAAHSVTYRPELVPVSMEMMQVIASTPIKLLSHCIHRPNTVRAKLLFLLIEISPFHLSVFGCFLLNNLSEDLHGGVNSTAKTNDQSLSDQDYLMLMPAAFSYISSSWKIVREQSFNNFECLLSFYSRILLEGFSNWKCFVSSTVFQVEHCNFVPASVENLHDLFRNSLLGKAVHMLQWHFALTDDKMSKRLKLYRSICLGSCTLYDFLDIDTCDIDSYSVGQLLNFINRVIAKISLSLVLLFPESSEKSLLNESHDKEVVSIDGFNEEGSLRVGFLDMLVSAWQWVVKKLPSASDNSEPRVNDSMLLRSLEVFLLQCISKLTMEMHNHLIQKDSLPFLEKMARVSLRHRFGDPTTLETLQHILSSLSDGNLPVVLFLELLLGHSQLAPTISTFVGSSDCTGAGMLVKPISSFLRSLVVHSSNSNLENQGKHKGQFEVIKLLRLLFNLGAQQGSLSEDELGVNWRELLLLLLPSYGATISDIDMELYSILSQIECAGGMDHSIIADLDYLWGSAALRVRKDHPTKSALLDGNMVDAEDIRRSQFRDNLPIDIKLLTRTILCFPYERTMSEKSLVLSHSYLDNIRNTMEEYSLEHGGTECYDPVFVLSFSIYSLSMGYLDPVEFTGLGLLAIALVSMASPADGLRKLGYEVLGRLKVALEASQKKREASRLMDLLAYLQNAIDEPWQKIPSIAAVFVAEASVILLDSLHDHYSTISKMVKKAFQVKSIKIDLEAIPLFQDMFWSSSKSFRTDRMWMLRLLYAGINSENDGHMYIRSAVPENLLNIYGSPLSNNEEKDLILQVLRKCIKVQNVARHLVEKCCLLSWLSSVLSLSWSLADQDMFSSRHLLVLLEVVHEIVSNKSNIEWFKKYALEQLADLTCHLFNLLVRCSKLAQDTLPLFVLVLKIITSTLEISQKRETHQPHFTPSIWSLYELYQAVDKCDKKSSICAKLGLKAILMSIPQAAILSMGQQELSQFLIWAVATAIESDHKQGLQPIEITSQFRVHAEPKQEESLMSSLLRWLVASVILWRASSSQDSNRENLLSLMENSANRGRETKLSSDSKEVVAVTIFNLQQLLGVKCRMLPSVVAALSILHLSDGSYSAAASCGYTADEYVRPEPRQLLHFPWPSRHSSEPQQVHVSLAGENHMRVSWITDDSSAPSIVEYGTSPGEYTSRAEGESTTYSYIFYSSGKIHHTVIGPLNPSTVYFYRCGGEGPEFQLRTPPAQLPVTFAVAGDLGQTGWTKSTLDHIDQCKYDVHLLPGDLSYADYIQHKWDSFGELVQPLASARAWMVTEGNHERESIPMFKDGFQSYNARWRMPFEESGSSSNLYYSFEVAGVHVLMLGSYTDYDEYSDQYTWLRAELAKVDRQKTPWLLALFHVPWYNSNMAHQGEGDGMMATMEPLLHAAGVDIVLTGHVHAYERTKRAYNGKSDRCGAVHITIGDGGNNEGLARRYKTPQPEWSVFREASFGHGELRIVNASHAYWSWHRNDDDEPVRSDDVWITSLASSGCLREKAHEFSNLLI